MSHIVDHNVGKLRHEDMLREAANNRLARQVRKANGNESLLSRMVRLLSRSSSPARAADRPQGTFGQRKLADA